jgi:uncharacterized protein involved in outer membrane biogenesis
MAFDRHEIRSRAAHVARHPRTRKIAIWLVSVIIAIGILGALVAPPVIRSVLESRLSEQFHRQVSIRQIRINPYAMTATVRGFLMKERQSSATAVSFDELHVNLQLQSLFRLAPVVKELRLVKPYVNLVRNEDRTYNYQDLMQPAAPGPAGPPPRFALHNIEIVDGQIDFDDRPEQTQHKITAIRIGVPFISSLPSQADIKVQPAFSALVNGAPLAIDGEAKPFKDSQESLIHINLDKLQISKYLEYAPMELNFKIPSGEINGKLTASFRTAKGKPAVLTITGDAAVHDLAMQDKSEAPLIKLPSLELALEGYDVIGGKAGIKAVKARGLEVDLRRSQDGKWNLAHLIERPAPTAAPAETDKSATPFVYHLGEILIESGKLRFTDEASQRRYETRLDNVRIDAKGLTNEAGKKAAVEISFESDNKERVSHTGELQLTPLLIDGKLEIAGLRPAGFRAYYQTTLAAEIRDGVLDASTAYSVEQKSDRTDVRFSELNAALRNLRLELPGQPEPVWRIGSLAIKDATVDIDQKTILIGMLQGRDGAGFLQREPDGTLSYARLLKSQPSQAAAQAPAKADDAAWKIETKQIALDGFRLNFDDRAAATPAKTSLSDFSIRAENFSNAKNRQAKVMIRTRINNKGALRLVGSAGASPVAAKFTVEARDIELAPFQAYFVNQVNFVLNGGRLGTKGELTVASAPAGPAKVAYDGAFQVLDFATVEKDGAQDLLKWKSLGLAGVHFELSPMELRISEIDLEDFYSRLILGSDGKINLQNLRAQNADPDAAAAAKSAPAEPPAQPGDPAPASERRVTIGKINLQGGNVQFSDFFVKPNYSANLTGVKGSISELKPEAAGDLVLEAKLDDAAPVEIAGKINPLSKELFLDIEAHARDIELGPFSPYSGKYVGYGIEKGKLSFNVKYKLEDRKLTAENQIILNQLTFGERIESPTATKLPVLLAVALLKDRNGVIDVNLPVSGSLDDPQFSVGGIVLRLVINLITRAVTAPFTLLGSIFGGGGGGGGEELSYIEFDYGRADLSAAAEAKIKTLATAMNNRPALKLQISGRADPANDLEGLKKVGLERKVKAQKLRELARQGNAPKSVDDVRVEKDEYERFLKAAYGEENFPKPRNVIGLAKDLPAPEMESLMLKNAKVSDEDVRELANRRAQAVRERLLATEQITADRLSIVAPKPASAEEKEKAKARLSRVDFTLG